MFLFGYSDGPLLYPLWFLRDLFILNLLSKVFLKVIRLCPNFFGVLFVILWLTLKTTNIFCFNVEALCFWGLGCCIVCCNFKLNLLDGLNKKILSIIYIITIFLTVILKDTCLYFVLNRIVIIIGLIYIFVVCTNIKNSKVNDILLRVSKYNFGIYLFHEMALTFLRNIFWMVVSHVFLFCILEYFILPIIVIVGALFFSKCLETKFPRVYAIIMGKNMMIKEDKINKYI